MDETVEQRQDIALGTQLKKEGMELAANVESESLCIARHLAIELAVTRRDELITADDVREAFFAMYPKRPWGNFAGSIFKVKGWHAVGFGRSKYPQRHASVVRLWKYNDPKNAICTTN